MVSIRHVSAPAMAPESTVKQSSASSDARQGGRAGADLYIPSERSPASEDYSATVAAERGWGPRFDALRGYVLSVLREQGVDTQALAGTQGEAAAAIADDGYWGIEQTAGRIVEFALAQAHGDPGRMQKIRAAIDKGYEQVREAFGGWLPEISMRTIERVHERLDAWERDGAEAASAS
jgi:hypothetical protein